MVPDCSFGPLKCMVSMVTVIDFSNGGRPTKSIVSMMLHLLEHYSWYQIKAKMHALLPMDRYVNYVSCIFMNIYENLNK